jgi:endonuclease/exonuclease/phosphatase family metal-dependent hydrolase
VPRRRRRRPPAALAARPAAALLAWLPAQPVRHRQAQAGGTVGDRRRMGALGALLLAHIWALALLLPGTCMGALGVLLWLGSLALAFGGSALASVFKCVPLADAAFRLWLLLGGPLTVALHLTSWHYGLAPSWLEPAFHRWRVTRYFGVGRGSHSTSRAKEMLRSARPYRALALPECGTIVRWDYRDSAAARSKGRQDAPRQLRVVSWNLEFGYLLGPIIEELQRLQPDVLCIQEVDVHSDATRQVSVDVGRTIAQALGLTGVWAGHHRYTDEKGDGGVWGCAVLSKFDITEAEFLGLPCLEGYPRGAVLTTVRCGGALGDVRVVSMHTEVCCTPEFRLGQLAEVAQHPFVARDAECPTIIAGDMNTLGGQFILRISPIHRLTVRKQVRAASAVAAAVSLLLASGKQGRALPRQAKVSLSATALTNTSD